MPAVGTSRTPEAEGSASGALLRASGVFWFVVTLLGQWAFFYYIAAFYGASTLAGDLEIWNRLQAIGRTPYVAGDTVGNLAYAAHALGAGIVAFGGALQLIPQIRRRAPVLHRWNGRVFLFTVVALSLSGFYLVWVRGTSPSTLDGLSTSLNGLLILAFAGLALRAAIGRDIAAHHRWAMRLFLVSNAQWFLRIGVFGYFISNGMVGNEVSFSDPFFGFWRWGCFLAPLAVLQLYFLARDRGGALARTAMAVAVAALTLVTGAGIFAFGMFSQALITGAPLGFPG